MSLPITEMEDKATYWGRIYEKHRIERAKMENPLGGIEEYLFKENKAGNILFYQRVFKKESLNNTSPAKGALSSLMAYFYLRYEKNGLFSVNIQDDSGLFCQYLTSANLTKILDKVNLYTAGHAVSDSLIVTGLSLLADSSSGELFNSFKFLENFYNKVDDLRVEGEVALYDNRKIVLHQKTKRLSINSFDTNNFETLIAAQKLGNGLVRYKHLPSRRKFLLFRIKHHNNFAELASDCWALLKSYFTS